jgi:hypothetical protein
VNSRRSCKRFVKHSSVPDAVIQDILHQTLVRLC